MKTPAFLILFLVLALRAEDHSAAAEFESDVWYRVIIDSNHVGWVHESSRASIEGEKNVITTVREEVDYARMISQFPLVSTRRQEFVETVDGRPLRFVKQELVEGTLAYEARGELVDGEMRVVMSWGTKDDKRASFGVPADLAFPHAIRERIKRTGAAAGAKFTYGEVTYEGGRTATRTGLVVGVETIQVGGRPVNAVRVKETVSPTSDTREALCDDTGLVLRIESNDVVVMRSTQEEAVAVPGHEEK